MINSETDFYGEFGWDTQKEKHLNLDNMSIYFVVFFCLFIAASHFSVVITHVTPIAISIRLHTHIAYVKMHQSNSPLKPTGL